MRTLIVDDEPSSRNGIRQLLSRNQRIELVGEAFNAQAFRENMENLQPDLVLLDIMLRNTNSLDIMNSIENKPLFIITTAYSQHALRGFDFHAIDYLLKPVSEDRLTRAIERAFTLFCSQQTNESEYIYLKSDGKYYRFHMDEILFIKGMENYVIVQTNAQRLICKTTMSGLKQTLPENVFIQIHKSYIVNVNQIDVIEKLKINIQSHSIPISRDRKQEVYEKLLGNR